MQNVLGDLAIESEAATISSLRLARSYDEGNRRGRRGPGLQADRQRGAQVLDLQAGPEPRGRVPRVPRRQRLRRGVGHAAPLPRGAARLDLGGPGTSSALDVIRAMIRNPESVEAFANEVGEGRCSSPGWTGSRRSFATTCAPIPPPSRRGPALWSSGWRSPSRARCWSASATRRWPMRSAPRASRASGAFRRASARGAAAGHRLHADHRDLRRAAVMRGHRAYALEGEERGRRDPRRAMTEEFVLVITGEGDAFCAGWDLQDAAELGEGSLQPDWDGSSSGRRPRTRSRCSPERTRTRSVLAPSRKAAPWSGRITACSPQVTALG